MLIPHLWMPAAKIDRIILHWTAGSHKATDFDRKHYHVLIEGDGKVVRGFPTIDLNGLPKAKTGYAAHTLNCNTGSIGLSMCAMGGNDVKERPLNAGKWPLTRSQWEAASTVAAELCAKYGIKVTPKTVLSHAEVQANLGIKQRGKWDIAVLPFDPSFNTAKEVGDRFRAEVLAKMAGKPAAPAPKPVEAPKPVVVANPVPPAPPPPAKPGSGKAAAAVVVVGAAGAGAAYSAGWLCQWFGIFCGG
jgi:hypothetical protein